MENNEQYTAIPDYSRYKLSRDGIVVDTFKNFKKVPLSVSSSGYLSCMLWNDSGIRTGCFLHRLLMNTFKPNLSDDKNLVVNHIDGDRLNNHLDNLEWISKSDNCKHAGLLQLSIKSVPVILIDTKTDKKLFFESISDCAKYLKIHKDSVRTRLRYGPEHISRDGYKLMRLYPTKDGDCNHNSRATLKDSYKKRVLIRNLFEHTEEVYDSITIAAKALNMSLSAFSHRFDLMLHPIWYGGLQLKYFVDDRPWRECDYWCEIREYMPRCPVIEVIDFHTNLITRYETLKIANMKMGISLNILRDSIFKNKNRIFCNRYLANIFPNISKNICPMEKQFSIEKLPNCEKLLKLYNDSIMMK